MNNLFSSQTASSFSEQDEDPTDADNSVAVNDPFIPGTETAASESQQATTVAQDEQNMRGLICCGVCFELRRSPMYKCTHGHLICAGCLNDILAQSCPQNGFASCPHCQAAISKDLHFRNVFVEDAISEIPMSCPYCCIAVCPALLKYHKQGCKNRPVLCSNRVIGCPWQGPDCAKVEHEQECKLLSATGYEIMESLATLDTERKENIELHRNLTEMLSSEKIAHIDLQLKYCKAENENICFETSNFFAVKNQWMIRAYCVSDSSKNFSLSYQLVLKTKVKRSMKLGYIILSGPNNDMEIKPKVFQFQFGSDKAMETPYQSLDLPRALDQENFLAAKRINIRIIIFVLK